MTKKLIIICSAVIMILGMGEAAQANLIKNGDIENNTASATKYNMNNATFNATVADATAFGTSQEIDLITGLDYGIAPQSGRWKLALHQNTGAATNVDAFSFHLYSPLVSGNSYNLQFFAAGKASSPLGPVEIGLAFNATTFGTLIFSGTPAGTTEWTQFDYTFIAPSNASFLTVRNATVEDMYVFVDNFTLVPEPVTIVLFGLGGLGLIRRKRKMFAGGKWG